MDLENEEFVENVEGEVNVNNRNQYVAGTIVSFSSFCAGTTLGWTSPAFEHLLKPHSPIGSALSTTEQSVVGATLMLGGLVAAIPSGKLADYFGRKTILIIIGLFYLSNFIMLGCARTLISLAVGRFLAGLALGGGFVVTPLYIGEVCEGKVRGRLGGLMSVQIALGLCYVMGIGHFCNWAWLHGILGLTAAVFIVGVCQVPETPVYFMRHERYGRAKNSLTFFLHDDILVAKEFNLLKKLPLEEGGSLCELLRYKKSLVAGVGIFLYQNLCGVNAIIIYLVPILEEIGSSMSALTLMMLINLSSLNTGLLSIFIIEKFSRKFYLILSSITMLISTVGLTICFLNHTLQLLSIIFVILFMMGFAIGMGPVPWILMMELYPSEVRGVANGVNILVNWLGALLITYVFPFLIKGVGMGWTFAVLGAMNGMGLLFVWWVVPETKGMAFL